ncbi:DUF4145 domain-containing protein [Psychrobacter aquimaris]|uniref:DUF4145 domain-containing protein n=1 Tax=Psychrobacter aquimaris TaxID=292733 RepID=UPI003FD4E9EA
MEHPEFEPEWIEYIFNCVFECNNDRCDGKVLCTGHGSVDIDIEVDDNGQQRQEYNDYYRPLYFHPNLKLIILPDSTPSEVKELLNESFSLFFTSPASAANIVRKSIEEILNDLKVGMPTMKNGGEKTFINLDKRINQLSENFENLKNRFFAIKWLGNAGSHSGDGITADDAMDAYELVEDLLLKIYGSKDDELNMLASKINTSRGPKK